MFSALTVAAGLYGLYSYLSYKDKQCLEKKNEAALKIQKFVAPYLGLLRVSLARCKDLHDRKFQYPKISPGKTLVYSMGRVVMKMSGLFSQNRFHQMVIVRNLIKELNLTSIVVPKARCFTEYLVEEKLPIESDIMKNMLMYSLNPQAFNQAVGDMVTLFSKCMIYDLVNKQIRLPLNGLCDDVVRFDNLVIYFKGQRAMIGLIDLEQLQMDLKAKPATDKQLQERLSVLVRIFPYHEDVIREKAQELSIHIDDDKFCRSRDRGMIFYDKGAVEWHKFQKSVTESRVLNALENIEQDKKGVLINLLIDAVSCKIRELNAGSEDPAIKKIYGDGYVGCKDFVALDKIQEISQLLVRSMISSTKEIMQGSKERFLVLLNNSKYNRNSLFEATHTILFKHCPKLGFCEVDDVAHCIFVSFFTVLQDQKIIYRYDPLLESRNLGMCLICH
jgi:hypothetical protein